MRARWALPMRSRPFACLLALALISCGGCGGGRSGKPNLSVAAAASLRTAFLNYGPDFRRANVHFSFGGSDLLAAQIEVGVRPDVFAAADTALPERLYARGLIEKPSAFAANQLVLAVPAGSKKVNSLGDLEKAGVSLAIGSPAVPVGAYTRAVLGRLGAGLSSAVLGHVRSQEPDISGIVGKLTQGAVDAGFVYLTDVKASRGRLHAILLPRRSHPTATYSAGVVRGSAHPALARRFILGLLSGPGRRALLGAGFRPARSR